MTDTFDFNVLNRFSGDVQFTAKLDIELKTKHQDIQLGAAVKWGLDNGARLVGADLYGADLERANLYGANLYGANLVGAYLARAYLDGAKIGKHAVKRLISRAWRTEDPYEFIAFETDIGRMLIRAGCFTGLIDEARKYVASNWPDTSKASETLDILDFFEKRHAAMRGLTEAYGRGY